jgi:cobalt-zinc-cadmium efflux system outer membrane protein
MKTRYWALPSILAATALMAVLPGNAQTPAREHPIKRGLEGAWSKQPEQQSAALRRDAADAALRASQRWAPDAAALEVTAKTDRFTRNEGNREYDATVAIPLWLPGERSRVQSAAQADAAAVNARLGLAQWKLADQVRTAYWEHARSALEVQLAYERLRNAQHLAADVAKRLKAGDLARADGHQAEGAVANAEANVAEAQAAATKAARRWQTTTGLAALQTADLQDEIKPTQLELTASHPELNELAAKAEGARRQRELAGVQTRSNPELTVGAVRERGAFGERYDQSVVVGVRIPLGASSASGARIAAAGAEQLEAETTLALARQRISADIAAAQDDVQALQASSEAAERRARLARESRGFFEKSFRLGETDLPTRLRVDFEAFEAERQAARARIELSAAISSLRQALGLLPE